MPYAPLVRWLQFDESRDLSDWRVTATPRVTAAGVVEVGVNRAATSPVP